MTTRRPCGEARRALRPRAAPDAARAFLAALLVPALVAGCVHTAPFHDAEGNVLQGSIATMESVPIGGVPQSIWFRGERVANPALILLHGGPGASEAALFRHFNAALERHFLVVSWEQRGTGRSYHPDIPPESMTVAQFLDDLDEVVELVRTRFGKDKVVLLGHSWGTVLGTLYAARRPHKVAAYVGVAQLVHKHDGARISYRFALDEAKRRDDRSAVSALEALTPVPRSVDEELALGRWVERFGGAFHENRLSTGKLILAALGTDEAGLVDLAKFGQGNRFSLEHLWPEYSTIDLTGHRTFAMPVFFLLGRHDRHVPSSLAERYFATIAAPSKRLVWFEESAHNPPFEEPAKFNAVLIREVRPLAER